MKRRSGKISLAMRISWFQIIDKAIMRQYSYENFGFRAKNHFAAIRIQQISTCTRFITNNIHNTFKLTQWKLGQSHSNDYQIKPKVQTNVNQDLFKLVTSKIGFSNLLFGKSIPYMHWFESRTVSLATLFCCYTNFRHNTWIVHTN